MQRTCVFVCFAVVCVVVTVLSTGGDELTRVADVTAQPRLPQPELPPLEFAVRDVRDRINDLHFPVRRLIHKFGPVPTRNPTVKHPNMGLAYHGIHHHSRATSVFVGLLADSADDCAAAVSQLLAHTRSPANVFVGAIIRTGPKSCAGALSSNCRQSESSTCYTDQVRERFAEEPAAHSPTDTLAMMRSERFVMLVDAKRLAVAQDWDAALIEMYKQAAASTTAATPVLSHRPPADLTVGLNVTFAQCDVSFEAAAQRAGLPSIESTRLGRQAVPTRTPFASTAFAFAEAHVFFRAPMDANLTSTRGALDWHWSAALAATGHLVYAPQDAVLAVAERERRSAQHDEVAYKRVREELSGSVLGSPLRAGGARGLRTFLAMAAVDLASGTDRAPGRAATHRCRAQK